MTRLKALELVGFKSFADRTRFEFPDGVTAIVGPNGSGKSNVVDAIKWVLGEQSVKSLRGREMADVIFAGSGGRRPLNSAEATLVFDNSARGLPVEADEVMISRRVYRSGESDYLVNGSVSRLRDIREILSGTGAATEAYSVIEQGRVDALLVASGRDRRAVFEEAAGITRFRSRRAEAIRRLERTEQSRQRLVDILGEIGTRLATVKQQAARARRHQERTARLRFLRLATASTDLRVIDAEDAAHASAITRLQEEQTIHEAVLDDASTEIARLAAEESALADAHDAAATEHAAAGRLAAAAAATTALLEQRSGEARARAADNSREHDRERRRSLDAERALHDAQAVLAAAERDLAAVESRLAACRHAEGGSTTVTFEVRSRVAEDRRRLKEAEASHTAAATTVARLEDALCHAGDAVERATADLNAAREAVALVAESQAVAEAACEAARERIAHSKADHAMLESLGQLCATRAASTRDAIAEASGRLEACRERAAVLEEIDAAAADGGSTDDFAAAGLPGVRGLVADQIDADSGIAALVDAAIGRLTESLLVETSAGVIEWLDRDAGPAASPGRRRSLLLADIVPPPEDATFEQGEGVVGRLDRLLGSNDAHHPAVKRLLGHAWVVDDLPTAARLLPSAPNRSVLVTRRGETLSGLGVLDFGRIGAAGGRVSRRAERSELAAKAAAITASIGELQASLSRIEHDAADVRDAAEAARRRLEEETLSLASATAEATGLAGSRDSGLAAVASAEAALGTAADREREARSRLESARAVEASLHDAAIQAGEALAGAEAAAEAFDRSRSEALETMARARIEEAECRQRRMAAEGAVAAHRRDRDDSLARLESLGERLAADLRQCRTIDLERLRAGNEFAEASWAAETAAGTLRTLAEARSAAEARRAALIATSEQARDAVAGVATLRHAEEMAAGEVRHRRERILERLRDDYGPGIESELDGGAADPALPDREALDREALDREIEDLRRKLAASPSVNLEAVAEAEELDRRHASMEAQLRDLTEAKASVESLIERIDDESRQLLGETIETVRGHFRGLFESLFGGGQADIVLDPTMDLLETTVEIIARPPGKEPRSISLLSGGEKTMTCVALLLAIFKSRPSPFCVLDEVDAALDEANVDRFVGVLRDFLSATQFILVTHSKKTMAAADNLYGVTMEESGVSKRVAVRLERAHAAAVARAA